MHQRNIFENVFCKIFIMNVVLFSFANIKWMIIKSTVHFQGMLYERCERLHKFSSQFNSHFETLPQTKYSSICSLLQFRNNFSEKSKAILIRVPICSPYGHIKCFTFMKFEIIFNQISINFQMHIKNLKLNFFCIICLVRKYNNNNKKNGSCFKKIK